MGVFVGRAALWYFPYRVEHKEANDPQRICIGNLLYLEGSKRIAAQEMKLEPGTAISREMLVPYMECGWHDCHCPSGGTYMLNAIGQKATCSIPGHAIGQ
jgi:hypothetical protein